MGTIIAIGEKKRIQGNWYKKERAPGEYCTGGTFERKCPLPNLMPDTDKAIEDGGSECRGTIWTRTTAPRSKKAPAKPKTPKLHTWSPYELGISPKDTKNLMLIRAQALMDAANQLGTENAKLKNTITRLKKKVSK